MVLSFTLLLCKQLKMCRYFDRPLACGSMVLFFFKVGSFSPGRAKKNLQRGRTPGLDAH
jgi:hypothetical protein